MTELEEARAEIMVLRAERNSLYEACENWMARNRDKNAIFDRLRALAVDGPEEAATSGRDFGRGYSLAVKDMLEILP